MSAPEEEKKVEEVPLEEPEIVHEPEFVYPDEYQPRILEDSSISYKAMKHE
jgi:hypothetical protein